MTETRTGNMSVAKAALAFGVSRQTIYAVTDKLAIPLPLKDDDFKRIGYELERTKDSRLKIPISFPIAGVSITASQLSQKLADARGIAFRSAMRIVAKARRDQAKLWDLYKEVSN